MERDIRKRRHAFVLAEIFNPQNIFHGTKESKNNINRVKQFRAAAKKEKHYRECASARS